MSADPQTIGVYDARADDYADTFGKGQKPGARLLDFCAQLPTGGRVLDYGCGPATDGAHMAAMGFEVHAFDASDKMVQAARANGVGHAPVVEAFQRALRQVLPFGQRSGLQMAFNQ